MKEPQETARVIDVFPISSLDGDVRFTSWPEATAALVVEGLARLLATRPGELLLCGDGLTVLLVLLRAVGTRRAGARL